MATQQNAPIAGQGDEGEDQNPTNQEENQAMTSVTDAAKIREARAAAAKPGTVAADPDISIEDVPDPDAQTRTYGERAADVVSLRDTKLAEDVLARAPLFIVQSTRHALVWRSGTGAWFRRGGAVHIRQWDAADGAIAFVVYLHVGANKDDLEFLLDAVEKARRGHGMTEWERRERSPRGEGLNYKFLYTSSSYDDPYVYGDRSPKVVVCDERECVHKWHTEYGEHVIDSLEKKLPGCGYYSLSIYRPLDEDQWKVSVYTDEFFGTPDDAVTFVNDLQWMTGECRRANAARTIEKAAA